MSRPVVSFMHFSILDRVRYPFLHALLYFGQGEVSVLQYTGRITIRRSGIQGAQKQGEDSILQYEEPQYATRN